MIFDSYIILSCCHVYPMVGWDVNYVPYNTDNVAEKSLSLPMTEENTTCVCVTFTTIKEE